MDQIYFTADLHFGHPNILKHSPPRQGGANFRKKTSRSRSKSNSIPYICRRTH